MKNNSLNLRKINITAMFIAIDFILVRFLKIMIGNTIRISFGFIPIIIISILYGPFWSGVTFAISDILGAFIFPVGIYHPGFTISAFLKGFIYGIFLYKRNISFTNIFFANIFVIFGINLFLDTFWLSQLISKDFSILFPIRLFKCFITLPLETFIFYFSWQHFFIKIPYISFLYKNRS